MTNIVYLILKLKSNGQHKSNAHTGQTKKLLFFTPINVTRD